MKTGMGFLLPGSSQKHPQLHSGLGVTVAPQHESKSREGRATWGVAVAGLALGAHAGLLCALRRRGRSAVKAAETAAEQRLFESVYLDYTSEYLKGPMYFPGHVDSRSDAPQCLFFKSTLPHDGMTRNFICSSPLAVVLCIVALVTVAGPAFLLPGISQRSPRMNSGRTVASQHASNSREGVGQASWGAAVAGFALAAHVGLFCTLRRSSRTAAKAAETAAEQRLFESVYLDYTSEYLKGPMYFQEDKLQGFLPDYPGNPMFKNGKMTSNATGNLKTFSSNELAFLSLL
eukprot:CAMPEP_0172940238 /NCGR_PEP_ID=MMETSP1075-20121228/223932_1 /TAXON_ID=2916 /ORGANISM="Ceratium fusus, Strain PA161109" /LENGTH=288 /DNA_ID=CAMNT_0013801633 /DNA_START=103 /DNA_END=966 /DNA_ORIENTATION=-